MIKHVVVSQISRSTSISSPGLFSPLHYNTEPNCQSADFMLKNIANGIKEACNGDLTHRNRPGIHSPGGVQYDKGKAGEATQKARRRSRFEKSSKSVTHLLSRAPGVHTYERYYSLEKFSGRNIRGSFHGNHLKRFATRSGYLATPQGCVHSSAPSEYTAHKEAERVRPRCAEPPYFIHFVLKKSLIQSWFLFFSSDLFLHSLKQMLT